MHDDQLHASAGRVHPDRGGDGRVSEGRGLRILYEADVLVAPMCGLSSVIIPAVNEEAAIGATLDSVRTQDPPFEIIVVDGGSVDGTREIAARKARVLESKPGRAHQMNTGDRKSTRLNSSHVKISYAVFCLKKKTQRRS